MIFPDAPKAVILAIDDEPEILQELTAVLVSADYACHTATSAEAALGTAKTVVPDLIISDIDIGGDSGLELCQKFRAKPQLVNVPVIFLSGAQIPDAIKQAHAAGGTYYLRKPFDPQVLLELVDKTLWLPHLAENKARGPGGAVSAAR